MAHHSFFVGYTDPIPDGHVPDGVEYTLLWKQLYASPNFDAGGTWAPSAFITVGGSGFEFTGTGHTVAASGRLSVASTGEIRVLNGGTIKLDGTGGDILLQVLTNVATLTVQTGAVLKVDSGGAVDLTGSQTVQATGNVIWASGAFATFQSSSTLNQNSGATWSLNGTTSVKGTLTIENTAGGGPGSLIVESDASFDLYSANSLVRTGGALTWQTGANLTGAGGSVAAWSGSWAFAGATTFSASTVPLLSPARAWTRHAGRIAGNTYDGTSPLAYLGIFATHSPAPALVITDGLSIVSAPLVLFEFDPPPDGSTMVTVTVNGIAPDPGGALSIIPTYRVVRWLDGISASTENMSNITTDSHDGTQANFQTEVDTTITINANAVIDSDYRYGIVMVPPSIASVTVGYSLNIKAEGTLTSITGR